MSHKQVIAQSDSWLGRTSTAGGPAFSLLCDFSVDHLIGVAGWEHCGADTAAPILNWILDRAAEESKNAVGLPLAIVGTNLRYGDSRAIMARGARVEHINLSLHLALT
jgi:hypothetical protein